MGPEPIAIQVPVFTGSRIETIDTERQILISVITAKNESLSAAVSMSLRKYLGMRSISGEYRISRATLYRIVNSMPRKSFRSRNRNRVRIGERFSFRLPRTITIIRAGLDNYYLSGSRVHGLDSLREVLSIVWMKQYEKGVFVCSHMSAFLEYWLERNGFNADIVCTTEHCWIIVEVEPGRWIHVEATGGYPAIIPDRPFQYRYRDIYQALSSNQSGFDWWEKVREGEGIIGRG